MLWYVYAHSHTQAYRLTICTCTNTCRTKTKRLPHTSNSPQHKRTTPTIPSLSHTVPSGYQIFRRKTSVSLTVGLIRQNTEGSEGWSHPPPPQLCLRHHPSSSLPGPSCPQCVQLKIHTCTQQMNIEYQSKVCTHLLIPVFFFMFTIFYIVE